MEKTINTAKALIAALGAKAAVRLADAVLDEVDGRRDEYKQGWRDGMLFATLIAKEFDACGGGHKYEIAARRELVEEIHKCLEGKPYLEPREELLQRAPYAPLSP